MSSVEARITYRQDWPAYTRAQCEEKERVQLLLRGLCDGITQPPQTNGRPRLPLADVVYGATMKVYGGMSGRRATSDVRACAERGLMSKVPSYNSVARYLESAELAPLLKTLVHESAAPLRAVETTFATDSTGFATNTYARWFDERYGGEKKCQRWIKLHAQVGTVTNVIVSIEATESTVGDSVMLSPLLASSVARGFLLKELSADKAYLSNDNLTAVEAAGAVPYVPFKANSRGRTGRGRARPGSRDAVPPHEIASSRRGPACAVHPRGVNARRPGEENRTASQPVLEFSAGCAGGEVTACHCVANRCNGPLQVVAPADPIIEALDRARIAWISGRDRRQLRRDLLHLIAELED